MSDAFVSVGGIPAQSVRLHVGNTGPWHVLADLESDEPLVYGATVPVRIGDLTLVGTVDPLFDGTYNLQRKCRVVAGGGGWGRIVSRKGYHNDAGVKARLIAEDAARLVGEQIGTFVPRRERVGTDYARQEGPASSALEDAAGSGVSWWVDYAGLTHVGVRPAVQTDADSYDVVAYDPRERVATLALPDIAAVGIGSILATGLPEPRAVRHLELSITSDETRATVWLGGDDTSPERLSGLMRSIVARVTDRKLFGPWRYRLVRMGPDGRADLQPVRPEAGLPELAAIEVWGAPAMHANLTPGAHVLVQFVEGDRAQPVVTHVTPRGGAGWIPLTVTIGGNEGSPAARQGDAVEVLLPPAVFSGTISGAPASGALTFPSMKAMGIITAGSGKVRIA